MEYQPWVPISKPIDLKILGKLSEELGEAVQAIGRCIIQGMDEHNIKEGVSNREALQNEIADVLVNIEITLSHFTFDEKAMAQRILDKKSKLLAWHGALGE